jgi:predicted transcriptional regulator
MGKLDDRARARVAAWLAARPDVTQETIAAALGVRQSHISRYLRTPMRLRLDDLETIARVFGHTVCDLLDVPLNPADIELAELARALTPARREALIGLLHAWQDPPRRRKKRRPHR